MSAESKTGQHRETAPPLDHRAMRVVVNELRATSADALLELIEFERATAFTELEKGIRSWRLNPGDKVGQA
jgi:hypothetical protein